MNKQIFKQWAVYTLIDVENNARTFAPLEFSDQGKSFRIMSENIEVCNKEEFLEKHPEVERIWLVNWQNFILNEFYNRSDYVKGITR